MANIAISELDTTATSLNDEDLILVSKTENGGSSFTSAKMKGSVLKSQVGGCQFTEDKVKNACIAALTNKNISTLTSSQVSSVIDGKGLSTLTSSQVSSVIDGKNLSTLTSDQVGTVIDGKGLSTLTDNGVVTDVNISLAANESIAEGIYQLRLNQMEMKTSYDQYLANLSELITKIGNKIFSGTYGDNVTLILNISGADILEQPTMVPESEGGVYASGTRVNITAPSSSDTYKFLGWYFGTSLESNQQSWSVEVKSNITYTAKYQTCKTIQEWLDSESYTYKWVDNMGAANIGLEFTDSRITQISSNNLINDGHGIGNFSITGKAIRTPSESGYLHTTMGTQWITNVSKNGYSSYDEAKNAILAKKIFINC